MTVVEDITTEDAIPGPAPAAPRSLYRYATWVHVGGGAEQCSEVDERVGGNLCLDTGHFHAWCRLPNDFQQREIRDHALAGKARKIRQVRQNGTDGNEILESSLEELQGRPDGLGTLVDELIGYDWAKDFTTAVREVRDLDDETEDGVGEGAKLYAHIDKDQARFARLSSEDPERRNQDEFEELQAHIAAYQAKVQEHYQAIANPKRESFLTMDVLDVVGMVRNKRIEALGMEQFMHTYSAHEILACTYRDQVHMEPAFRDLKHLEGVAPEVLSVLQETFADLERTSGAAEGN